MLNKIANIKSKLGAKEFKPKLSSLIKVSSLIQSILDVINKLQSDDQKINYLDKYKNNVFMIDEFWYNDLSEEEKIQFHNLEIKFVK